MKKQKLQFLILLVLVVIGGAACIGLKLHTKPEQDETETEAVEITSFDTDKITAFSYETDGDKVSLAREGKEWKCVEDPTLDLDEDKVEEMLKTLKHVQASERVENSEKLEKYGFDKPANEISITEEDKTTVLRIGDHNDVLGTYYMNIEGEDALYLVDYTIPNTFNKKVSELTAADESSTEGETETE